MEIVLIRHGEPEWVRDGLERRRPTVDRAWPSSGRAGGAVALDGEEFDEIVISPLRRPRLTAAPLLADRGADEVIEPWLRGDPRAELARHAGRVGQQGVRGRAIACCIGAMGGPRRR